MSARLSRRRFLALAASGLGAAAAPGRAFGLHVDPSPPVVDLGAFGVVADGRTDDGPALARAFAAAGRVGDLTLARRGTLLVGQTVTVPAGVVADFGGSTILKGPTVNGPALLVAGDSVGLSGLTVDGNRRGGAHGAGIEWAGAGGNLSDATVRNTDLAGVVVRRAGADVICTRVTCNDHVSGVVSGDGFYAALGGRLRLNSCAAAGNDRAGVYLESSAAAGCAVNGVFDRNGVAGAYLKSPAGTSTLLRATNIVRFGVIMKQTASGWRFGRVEVTGPTGAKLSTLTGVELYGTKGNIFSAVIVRGLTGYGVALAKSDLDETPATGNRFELIDVDGSGTTDSDPGLHLSGGANQNTFTRLRVVAQASAISIGEGYLPLTNDRNTFGLVHAERCPYAVIVLQGGSANRFDRVEAVGCSTVDPAIAQGLIEFRGPATVDNVVGFLDASADVAGGVRAPGYLVYSDATARGNQVLAGKRGPTVRGVAADRSGGNRFSVS